MEVWLLWWWWWSLKWQSDAEELLVRTAEEQGFDYTIVRVGRLRGGGGDGGLGEQYYMECLRAKEEQHFDMTKRGFTMSSTRGLKGESGRVIVAQAIVKVGTRLCTLVVCC